MKAFLFRSYLGRFQPKQAKKCYFILGDWSCSSILMKICLFCKTFQFWHVVSFSWELLTPSEVFTGKLEVSIWKFKQGHIVHKSKVIDTQETIWQTNKKRHIFVLKDQMFKMVYGIKISSKNFHTIWDKNLNKTNV